jgi:hypothetical protein
MKALFTSVLILSAATAFTQDLFVNTYGTPQAEERAFSTVTLSDGSIITAGDRYETATFDVTAHILKVNPSGGEEWNRQITGSDDVHGNALCVLPNGNVLVVGYDTGLPNAEFGILVAEYNAANGLPVYTQRHTFNLDAAAVDVVPMPDNGATILSTYEFYPEFKTAMLVRTNASGDTIWSRVVDPFAGDETPSGLIAVDNGYIICGSVQEGTNDNAFLVHTDASGNIVWSEVYTASGIELAETVVAIPTGGFYVVGSTNATGNGGLDLMAMKVDANGGLVWKHGFGSERNDLGFGVDVMPDGGAVWTGSAYAADSATYRDLYLLRTDAAGDTLWTRHFGSGGAETGYDVTVDGNYIVAVGKADVDGTEDVLVVRADLNGFAAVGIAETRYRNYSVYPNPATDHMCIDPGNAAPEILSVQLVDMLGRTATCMTMSGRATMDVSAIPNGIYTLLLNETALQRVVVMH